MSDIEIAFFGVVCFFIIVAGYACWMSWRLASILGYPP